MHISVFLNSFGKKEVALKFEIEKQEFYRAKLPRKRTLQALKMYKCGYFKSILNFAH